MSKYGSSETKNVVGDESSEFISKLESSLVSV